MSQATKEQPRVDNHESQPKAAAGRAEKGRFAKGNPGGPGNPFARQMAMMREGITKAISAEQVAAMMAMVYEMAMERNLAAVKIVLEYAVGKPKPMVDPDRVDVDEWALRMESRVSFDAIEAAQAGLPAKMANPIAEVMSEKNVRELGRMVTDPEYAQEVSEQLKRDDQDAEEEPTTPEEEAAMAEMTRQWKEDRAREQAAAEAEACGVRRTETPISAKSAHVESGSPSGNGSNGDARRGVSPLANGANGGERGTTPAQKRRSV